MKTNAVIMAAIFIAAQAASAQTLTLDSCRQMAIHNNKTIRMADEAVTGAGHARKAARAAYLPGIDFVGTYMHNQHEIALLGADAKLPTMKFDPATGSYQYNLLMNPATGKPMTDPSTGQPIPSEVAVIPKEAMTYDTRNVFAGAFTLTQPVYMGGQIRAMNEITKYAEQMASSARNQQVQDLVYAVDEAYWLVVSLREKKKLAESFVRLVDTLQYNVKAMYDEGVATRSDVLTVEVKQNEANIALTKVDNGLTLSKMALAQLCGLPVDSPIEPADGAVAPGAQTDWQPVDMRDVYARRQDLQTIRGSISLLHAQEKLAMADMLPKLAIVGAYSFSNPNVINGFEKRFGGGFSIGATLAVPIWHWGGNYYKYKTSKSATNIQRIQLADLEEKVELQVTQARFKCSEAYKTYDMTVKNRAKADENLRMAQEGFREGVLTTNDVMAAQTAWLQAASEKIDAEIGVQLCHVYLDKVLGLMNY